MGIGGSRKDQTVVPYVCSIYRFIPREIGGGAMLTGSDAWPDQYTTDMPANNDNIFIAVTR